MHPYVLALMGDGWDGVLAQANENYGKCTFIMLPSKASGEFHVG